LTEIPLGPLERITLGRTYRVLDWISKGIETLANDFDKHSIEEIAGTLGWEKAARLSDSIFRAERAAMANAIPKARVSCFNCRSVPRSAQQTNCPCGHRPGDSLYRLSGGGPPDTEVASVIEAFKEIFSDDLKV
jgi:hypothetical protein